MTNVSTVGLLILRDLLDYTDGHGMPIASQMAQWFPTATPQFALELRALGENLPADEHALLNNLQLLVDEDLAVTWSAHDFSHTPKRVYDLTMVPKETTFIGITPGGVDQAHAFDASLDSYPLRDVRQALVPSYLREVAPQVSFDPVLPIDLPSGVYVVPGVSGATTDSYIKLVYDVSAEDGFVSRIVIEETLGEFKDQWPRASNSCRFRLNDRHGELDLIAIAPTWQALAMSWRNAIRVRVILSLAAKDQDVVISQHSFSLLRTVAWSMFEQEVEDGSRST